MNPGRALIRIAVPLLMMATACGAGGQKAGSSSASVRLDLREFRITSSVASAKAGPVTFEARNTGTLEHYLAVLRTNLPPDGLPLAGEMVIENGSGVQALADVVLPVGGTESTTLDLEPGRYVLICNIPGHYQAGMRAPFSVT